MKRANMTRPLIVTSAVATLLLSVTVVVCLSSINTALADSNDFDFPDDGRNIVPVSLGQKLLHPCSRPAPDHVSGFWVPSRNLVDELEKRLPAYLMGTANAGFRLPPSGAYDRQYVGIVQKGIKLIYVNFFPRGFREYDPSQYVIDVCDGGPKHWGVTFDPKRLTFANLSIGETG